MPEPLSKLEQLTLVLLCHTAFEERGDLRSWKGYDWGVMNRLHERGLITDPVGKTRSVFLTDEGRRQAEVLAGEYLGPTEARPSSAGPVCECGCGEPRPNGGFVPGHDQKLRAQLESRVGGLRALRDLVEAVEAYSQGRSTTEELTRELRALFAGRE
jgi:hypothetical protein